MDEKTARTRWCPMTRTPDSSENIPLSVNRLEAGDINCIASDCMMWRWDIRCTVKYDEFGYADDIEENEIDTGYCGLGGKQ